MRPLIFLLILFIVGCRDKRTQSLFSDLIDKADIEIHLTDYGLQNVPEEIGKLKNARRLYISQDSTTEWTLYPPLSAAGEAELNPPYRKLPTQITTLTKLESLTLVGLNLKSLPEGFSQLRNLDTLILYMNKLTISNELYKLKRLKKLKYIGLQGNLVTANDLKSLMESIPGIVTNPGLR